MYAGMCNTVAVLRVSGNILCISFCSELLCGLRRTLLIVLSYRKTTMTDSEKRLPRWYFGGMASAGAVLFTHPLDLVKVFISSVLCMQLKKTGKAKS